MSSAAGLDYTWSGAHGRWHAVLQAAYVSKVRCNQDTVLKTDCLRTPTFSVGTSQTRFDARLGWQSASTSLGGQWSLGLVVNNLFDKQYVAFVENVITRPFGIAYGGRTAPRKLMLEASVKF